MVEVKFPYGKNKLSYSFEESRLAGVLEPSIASYIPEADGGELISRASVIYVSEIPDDLVKEMHMIPAHSIGEAIGIAENIVGDNAKIAAIPDGVSVMVTK